MPVSTVDPYVALERKVSRRLRDDASHRRISAALAEVATAAMCPAGLSTIAGHPTGGFLEDPVESATRVALETLIDELEDLVDTLPPAALDQLTTQQAIADLGIE